MKPRRIYPMNRFGKWIWSTVLLLVVATAVLTNERWMPALRSQVRMVIAGFRAGGDADHSASLSGRNDPHSGHDHAHSEHDDASSLELSEQALRNIGLTAETLRPVELQTFRKTITVPAVVVEKPGQTRIQVATPMTGAITQVHAVDGEAVEPGTLLFQIRLTHEDLVQAQTNFVQTLGELDVEEREIARLEEVTSSGAIAGKLLLDRKYAAGKLTALLSAQREALRLHGLSDEQVERIAKTRRLLRQLQMLAPSPSHKSDNDMQLSRSPVHPAAFSSMPQNQDAGLANGGGTESAGLFILQDLKVHVGQSVDAGETLCVLKDFSELYIEGMAFESDITLLREASRQGWKVSAVFERSGSSEQVIEGLEIAYLANEIDTESRTLHFYVDLPNKVTSDRSRDNHRFMEWQHVPGQRVQLQIPIQEMPGRIVLPVAAVAREGAEYFVFRQNGLHFDRVAVHVEYRDQRSVVIANDGSLFPGDVVAMSGAHQMQMALRNKSGGAPDPHAGHNH